MLIWLWMALPLSYLRVPREAPKHSAMVRPALALAVLVIFAWDAGRIVLSRYWTERGYRREYTGDLAGAVADDRRSVEADPTNTEARFHLGRSQWKAGDSTAALRTLDDAVHWDAHPRVYLMRVRVLYRSGRRAEALHRAAEGARIFPWAPELEEWRAAIAAELMTERRTAETRP
jgi:tetratricopeptide (TPR) repeat protein